MSKGLIQLVKPHVDYKETFLDGLREFQAEGLLWVMDKDIAEIERNFEKFVEGELNKKTLWTIDTPVPETELWAVMNDTFVGSISIRHRLNEDLKTMGGHIGYDTRPSYRGRGIASAMLEQTLPIARDLGITEALLTCNDSNTHSIRVIEKNGGVLRETKMQSPAGPLKRYYLILLGKVPGSHSSTN